MSKSSEDGAAGNAPPQDAGQKNGNDSIYENRAGTKKIIRVITVMAYVFSVSFAAILLSAYYVFLWEPPNPRTIQRHPLSADPQVEYLTDDLLPNSNSNSNFYKLNASEEDGAAQNPSTNSEIFKRIMSPDKGEIRNAEKLVFVPQNFLEHEDLRKLYNRAGAKRGWNSSSNEIATRTTISDVVEKTSPSIFTDLRSFFKAVGSTTSRQETGGSSAGQETFPTTSRAFTLEDEENNIADGQKVGHSSAEETTSIWESFRVPSKRDERRNKSGPSDPSPTPAEMIGDETSTSELPEPNTAAINPAGLRSKIGNHSYPETIVETGDNKVTMIGNDGTTISAPTTPQSAPELDEDNLDVSLRKYEPRLTQDPPEDEMLTTTTTTTIPELPVYPEASARDILNRK